MNRRHSDPWGDYRRDREDISTAAAFFMTFALLGLVAWVVFFGTGWIVPAALEAIPGKATRTPSLYSSTSVTSPGVTFPLTSTTTSIVDPATSALAPVTAAPPTPTQKPTVARLRIGNTDGDGVYLRRSPNDSDLWIPWPDTTVVEYLGTDQETDGRSYKKVKDPRGNIGWMPAQYLVPAG